MEYPRGGSPLKGSLGFCPLATMKPYLARLTCRLHLVWGLGFVWGSGVFLDIFSGVIVDSCAVLRNNTKEILQGLYQVFPGKCCSVIVQQDDRDTDSVHRSFQISHSDLSSGTHCCVYLALCNFIKAVL